MITVGLTGNVASGKTTVAERWRDAGIVVIDADRLGHDVLAEDDAARDALVDAFGDEILDSDGSVDRSALGERAFASDGGVERLNAVVHPPLIERLEAALDRAREDGQPLAVVDAALVYEFGMDADLDRIVLVTAPLALRRERLRRERGLSDDRIDRIEAAQRSDDEKIDAADHLIVNDGSLDQLRAEADAVLAVILQGIENEVPDRGTSKETREWRNEGSD